MANEWTLLVEQEPPVPMTVANGTGIEKGTFLRLFEPNTASHALGTGKPMAGVAASEKIANDGNTTIGVYRKGIFRATASGAITAGDALQYAPGVGAGGDGGLASYANTVMAIPGYSVSTAASFGGVIGRAMETAADADTFRLHLNI